jgi:hypothetical protein
MVLNFRNCSLLGKLGVPALVVCAPLGRRGKTRTTEHKTTATRPAISREYPCKTKTQTKDFKGHPNIGALLKCRRGSGACPRYAALSLLKAFLTNKIVAATVIFRLFEGTGVVRGRGTCKAFRKKNAFCERKER